MAEIIQFGDFKKKQEEEKKKEEASQGKVVQETIGEKRARLFHQLSDDVQEMLTIRTKEIKASRESGNMHIDAEQLVEQKYIVSTWSDDEVVAFLENLKNHEQLKTKPHLTLALFGRVLGRL